MTPLFEPSEKIKLMEAFCTMPVCIFLGCVAAWIGMALSFTSTGFVLLSLALSVTFLLSPLAGMLRLWVRRRAESYYYGT